MPLESNTMRRAMAAVVIAALSGCSGSCSSSFSEGRADSGRAAASASTLRPTRVRTPRLDGANTTRELLAELAPDCVSCAEKNGCLDVTTQGAECESIAGISKVSGQTETALCLDLLRCIFTSKCANSGEQSQCVCGKADVLSCLDGSEAPAGSCIAEYRRDYGMDATGKFMSKEFLNRTTYGAGGANALVQCVMNLCPTCRIP
jgi:hypothetical protein